MLNKFEVAALLSLAAKIISSKTSIEVNCLALINALDTKTATVANAALAASAALAAENKQPQQGKTPEGKQQGKAPEGKQQGKQQQNKAPQKSGIKKPEEIEPEEQEDLSVPEDEDVEDCNYSDTYGFVKTESEPDLYCAVHVTRHDTDDEGDTITFNFAGYKEVSKYLLEETGFIPANNKKIFVAGDFTLSQVKNLKKKYGITD